MILRVNAGNLKWSFPLLRMDWHHFLTTGSHDWATRYVRLDRECWELFSSSSEQSLGFLGIEVWTPSHPLQGHIVMRPFLWQTQWKKGIRCMKVKQEHRLGSASHRVSETVSSFYHLLRFDPLLPQKTSEEEDAGRPWSYSTQKKDHNDNLKK